MSLANLKASRASEINKLVAAAEKVGGGQQQQSYEDNRMWKPEVDKAGNGFAVIRFLPAPQGDDSMAFKVLVVGTSRSLSHRSVVKIQYLN
jgi:hypothetical protein